MKRLIQIIAISCMPFLTGVADASDPAGLYDRYNFDDSTGGFERMGFGFAQPIITIIPSHVVKEDEIITGYKPVVIIAAGYDPTKDYIGAYGVDAAGDPGMPADSEPADGRGLSLAGDREPDKVGNAIYFVDAISGELVARIIGTTALPKGGTESSEPSKDIKEPGLEHSIPATITPVDSQGDGVTDRVYFVDIIGNVWRLDLAASVANWKLRKFASLGATGVDRRFFNQLDVVRTKRPDGTNADAILVGSGNIANPKESFVAQNAFFMLYDYNIQPLGTSDSITAITVTDLINAEPEDAATVEESINGVTSSKSGWYLPLGANEKVVSSATTVDGITYFTTIVAGPDTVGCKAPEDLPASYLYALRMHNGAAGHVTATDGTTGEPTAYARSKKVSGLAFQQIDPFVATDGSVSIVVGGSKEALKDSKGKDRKLEGAGSYWRTEDQ